jgi:hypothetical protein
VSATHHAYVYEGPQSALDALVSDARGRFGFEAEHSPDVHVRGFEKFGIDESRWLVEAGALKSSGGRALFVLGIASITSEAQQALLKLFEEPQEGSVYVVLVPHGTLMPTVRSRTLEYPARLEANDGAKDAKKFLALGGKERSDFAAKLLKDDEGAKERVRDFINALEAELYKKVKDAGAREALADIALVRGYLQDRSPSLKMLLEHLAVALPTA